MSLALFAVEYHELFELIIARLCVRDTVRLHATCQRLRAARSPFIRHVATFMPSVAAMRVAYTAHDIDRQYQFIGAGYIIRRYARGVSIRGHVTYMCECKNRNVYRITNRTATLYCESYSPHDITHDDIIERNARINIDRTRGWYGGPMQLLFC